MFVVSVAKSCVSFHFFFFFFFFFFFCFSVYNISFSFPPLEDTYTFVTSFRRRFYAYHRAMKHHHTNIILSLLLFLFVLKFNANNLKIGLRTKIFLIGNVCISKLLTWDVTVFPKNKV